MKLACFINKAKFEAEGSAKNTRQKGPTYKTRLLRSRTYYSVGVKETLSKNF